MQPGTPCREARGISVARLKVRTVGVVHQKPRCGGQNHEQPQRIGSRVGGT